MRNSLLFLAALTLATAAQAQPKPAPNPQPDAPILWVDWKVLTREALAAEAKAARPGKERQDPAEADARGKRVAEMVTSGDCAGAERFAREAGDFALARAARDYCAATPPK